ncbi:hypothetical protein [Rubinisphaera italica]|uniref:Uncharacterized protein n=1 Tax=Rubinisphaera italica TaxID=2527969 RepID=A0A5C5XC10_9PLAN|nr:hypothetical protein [Rubinisphaera italica]TWT60179.1 hypothetical protein Pan54_08930 [Rubinisphaera italica]
MRIISFDIIQFAILYSVIVTIGSSLNWLLRFFHTWIFNWSYGTRGFISLTEIVQNRADMQIVHDILWVVTTFVISFLTGLLIATLFNMVAPLYGGFKIGIAEPKMVGNEDLIAGKDF